MARPPFVTALIWTANLLGWPVIHLAIAAIFLRLPIDRFDGELWFTREQALERGGRTYREALFMHRWKSLLPDGAPWLGGASKKRIAGRNAAYLRNFAAETRRAESAHWCMLACTPVFYLWNPPWACVVMTAYGLAANLPCILTQRANRIQLVRILARLRSSRA
jgi:glycosyl-4,4'-diaponeurosporenoate acyltransferase